MLISQEYIFLAFFCSFKGYAFHSVLSILRVDINFVPFIQIILPFKSMGLISKSEHIYSFQTFPLKCKVEDDFWQLAYGCFAITSYTCFLCHYSTVTCTCFLYHYSTVSTEMRNDSSYCQS